MKKRGVIEEGKKEGGKEEKRNGERETGGKADKKRVRGGKTKGCG